MSTMMAVLEKFQERVQRKGYLQIIMRGWDKRVGVIVEDSGERLCMTVLQGRLVSTVWQGMEEQPVDLVLSGKAADFVQLFGGDELTYVHAKQTVKIVGTVRDHLKLDTLLRLTAENEMVSA
ncbi:SCP-2 sterol transfer family protein [Brevibacillus dissolubilis]|uniref:SCP-2 sterol transfer family protein n=1 Tax=Brevibacillus dissolubilis TaxID=1844116 RepID=UPI001115ED21|nr:SCP-2 sterol transfer family protein [Brevibacillus dissolubilis]